MAIAVELTRVFRFGSIELNDIEGIKEPEKVIQHYEPNYPELAFCKVGDSVREGDKLVYEIIKPTVKTKG